ncbi:MAG TPA: caspase family protein [Kofleriaceae bacterium]
MPLSDAHALVIGIAAYQRIAPLTPTQDAQDVAAALADPACAGYPAVQTLVDGAATRAAILDALAELARATTAGSTVFIYYSGHGAHAAGPAGDEYYLVPVDAVNTTRDTLAATAISNASLTAALRAIPAGRLTLVLDCCRAGDLAVPDLGEVVAAFGQGRGRVVLAASRASGEAYALPGQRDSVLTGFLVAGLRGAATGAGGVLRVVDLFQYVQEHVAGLPLDQHPVLRAELEENYAIAELHGGAAAPLVLPPPPDGAGYDAFVSYCEADRDDRAWVTGTLVPALEQAGLRLCLEDRDFALGAPRLEELDRAVTQSRYIVGVFSPAYLADPRSHDEALIAAQAETESRYPRLVPLLRRPCALALHQRMTAALDVSRDGEVAAALQRLALQLRQPPRPRLT